MEPEKPNPPKPPKAPKQPKPPKPPKPPKQPKQPKVPPEGAAEMPDRTRSSARTTVASRKLTAAPSWLVAAGMGLEKAEQMEAQEESESHMKMRIVFHVIISVCLVLTVITQCALLNYLSVTNFEDWKFLPYIWIVCDLVSIGVFIAAQILAYRYLLMSHFGARTSRLNAMFPTLPEDVTHMNHCSVYHFGVLPLCYISWLIYSIIMQTKLIVLIAKHVAIHLTHHGSELPLLQVAISLSSLVFFCLVEGHTWASRTSHRYVFVTMICAYTALEIIDTVSLMSMFSLFEEREEASLGEIFIGVLCCVSFMLPAFPLYILSMTDRSAEVLELPINIANDILHLLLLDVPYLVVRSYRLSHGEHTVFILLMKNVFFVIVTLRRVIPDVREMVRYYRYSRKALAKLRKKKEELLLKKSLDEEGGPGQGTGHGTAPAAPAAQDAPKGPRSKPLEANGAKTPFHKSNITTSISLPHDEHAHSQANVLVSDDELGGIADETRRPAVLESSAGDETQPPAPPAAEHKETDLKSLTSLSLSTLSTLTSSEEPEMETVSTQTDAPYAFPIPSRTRYVYPSRARGRGRDVGSQRRDRERQGQFDARRGQGFRGRGERGGRSAERPERNRGRRGRGLEARGRADSRAGRGIGRRNMEPKNPGRGAEGRGREIDKKEKGRESPGRRLEGRGRGIEERGKNRMDRRETGDGKRRDQEGRRQNPEETGRSPREGRRQNPEETGRSPREGRRQNPEERGRSPREGRRQNPEERGRSPREGRRQNREGRG